MTTNFLFEVARYFLARAMGYDNIVWGDFVEIYPTHVNEWAETEHGDGWCYETTSEYDDRPTFSVVGGIDLSMIFALADTRNIRIRIESASSAVNIMLYRVDALTGDTTDFVVVSTPSYELLETLSVEFVLFAGLHEEI